MTRAQALVQRPKRTLSALSVALLAAGVAVGSGADFSSRSANPANTFTAGTLSIDNSRGNGAAASAVLTAPNLKPGDSATGTVDIQNAGSVAGTFTLSTSGASDSTVVSLLGQLDVRIEDCGVYSDGDPPTCGSPTSKVLTTTGTKLNGVGSIGLGSFAGGEKHRYKFDVTLPKGTGNSFQGKSASIAFDWDAQTV